MIPLRDDNPTRTRPVVTVTILIACVVVFLWELSLPQEARQQAIYALGFIPAVALGDHSLSPQLALVPPAATVFTSMFLHGGLMHLAGNMLYLWIFGNNVEDAMGHGRFVIFYLLSGTAAAFAQALPAPESTLPMIGASGAISGVLGAYLLLHPYARVLVVIPFGFYLHPVHLPAMAVLGIWFALQILSSLLDPGGEGGVAWFAHIGGFVAGLVLIPLFRHRGVRLWDTRNPGRGRW